MFRPPLVAAIGVLALAACQQMPESKEPGASSAAPPSPAAANAVARVHLRSSIELRRPAGAGSTAPARSGAYPVAMVKDLAIVAAERKNFHEAERAEFETIKAELSQLFGAAFRDALQRAGYVKDTVGDAAPGAVVIQPTLTQFTGPANRGTMAGIHPGLLDFTVTVSDAATGNLLGSYQLHYEVFLRAGRLPTMDVQRRVFPDAGEKVAQAIAKAR